MRDARRFLLSCLVVLLVSMPGRGAVLQYDGDLFIDAPSTTQGPAARSNSPRMADGAPPSGAAHTTSPLPVIPQALGLDFVPAVIYGSGGFGDQSSVALADVNGDDKLDIVVTNNCDTQSGCTNGAVGVLLGNGDGSFQAARVYGSGGFLPLSVAVADVNGDGKPDIVVANCSGTGLVCEENVGSAAVLLGNGDGTFQAAVPYGSGGTYADSVALADLNGDGKVDVVVANQCGSDPNCNHSNGSVAVLLSNGDGTFRAAVAYGSGGIYASSVAVADVNGDGKPDLVVSNICGTDSSCDSNGSVAVLLGNGDGTFQAAVAYSSAGWDAESVAVATNGQGKVAIAVTNACISLSNCNNGTVGVLLGKGDGTFQPAVTYNYQGGGAGARLTLADVNGDGVADLLVASTSSDCYSCDSNPGLVNVLVGNGDGTFQTAAAYASGGYLFALGVAGADINGDGKPDVVVVNACTTPTKQGCPTTQNSGVVGVLINSSLTPATTVLGSSLNPSDFGQSVTFGARVTALPGFFKGQPTGTISFFDGKLNLGTSPLNNQGISTLTIASLAVGMHSITANYNGDTNFVPSTSSVLDQVVQGTGSGPVVTLSPLSLSFGNQAVDAKSEPQYVSLSNTGNEPLTISSISRIGDYSKSDNCPVSPKSLAVNASCLITIWFTPRSAGTLAGSIHIKDNALGSPQSISLTGVGVVSHVSLSTTQVLFKSIQLVGTSSASQTITLTNTSATSTLEINGITVTRGFALVSIANQCPANGSVAPNSSCDLAVEFSPKTVGTQHGTITITDSDAANPQLVGLSGTGTALQMSATRLGFGNVTVGKSLGKSVTLFNAGSTPINIGSITIGGASAGDFSQTNTCGSSLAAGAECFIDVIFAPPAAGVSTAVMSVTDSDPASPQIINLKGTGIMLDY